MKAPIETSSTGTKASKSTVAATVKAIKTDKALPKQPMPVTPIAPVATTPTTPYVLPVPVTPRTQDLFHNKAVKPAAPDKLHDYVWIDTDLGGMWSLHQVAGTVDANGNPIPLPVAVPIKVPVPTGSGDGSGSGDGTTVSLTAPGDPIDHSTESGTTAINDILNGLVGFSPAEIANFYNEYKSGLPLSRIVDDIRATPQYAQRFPGMAALVKTGNRISEANYIDKETADRQLLQNTFGASAKLYNSTAQLGDLIGKNVSTAELQNRLQGYTDAVLAAPASETQWFKDQGMSQGDLTSFWLNPDITTTDIQRRSSMGQLGAIAADTGTKISAAQANDLAAQGITPGQAVQGFGQIGMEGQFKQQLPGEANPVVTQQDLIDATFSNNAPAQQKINLLRQQRQAQFQEGGNMASTNRGVTGLGTAATQ